jgi:hypothetical protein
MIFLYRREVGRTAKGSPEMVDGDGRQRVRGWKRKDHTGAEEAGEVPNGGGNCRYQQYGGTHNQR